MTPDEARGKAAQIALEALDYYGREARGRLGIEYDAHVTDELKLIETWLRRRACQGDKVLIRQLEKPLGRQVRPAKKAERAIEGLANDLTKH
jgi:hypothetical protein